MKEKKNLTLNYIFVQVGMWAMYAPLMGYTSVFLLAKKFTNTEVGIISGLGCVISAVLQAMISAYADKEKSKSVKTLLTMIAGLQLVLAGVLLALGNHLFLVDVTKVVESGKVAQNLLDEVNITLNKNSIPYETLSPFKTSGIRIGAAAITARGFGEKESRQVAELIIKALKNAENEAVLEEVRSAVKSLTDAFPLYED